MSDTILSPMNLCPKCQNANPEGSKFCIQCGAPLKKGESKASFTLTQIDSDGEEIKSVQIQKSLNFSKSKEFPELTSKKNNVELILESGKIMIKDSGTNGVYIKIEESKLVELSIGQQFIIDGKFFRIS